jgi:hypothetical protein
MHWDQGYVSEIDYVYGYYSEFNPLQNKLNLISAGVKPPKIKTACELGFGQGVSLLFNAAGSDIAWYGNDFNPSHVSFVREAIDVSGLSLYVTDENFEQFCSRTDLPNFDFIALHGIWSWVSDANREIISRFIEKKLNVGGVLYLSYNAEPGRTSMRPFRELMQWHSTSFSGSNTPMIEKIDSAISFMSDLMEANPAFKSAYPLLESSFKEGIKFGKDYLAHEYFNADWEPMSIKRVSDLLAHCKIQFAASATHLDLLPNISFSREQLKLIQSIKDPIFKEFTKDMFLNQGFRRDLWIKGRKRLSDTERVREFLSTSVTLLTAAKDVIFDVNTPLGKADLNKDIYQAIIDCLEGKSTVKLDEVARTLREKITVNQLFEACLVLASKNVLCVALDAESVDSTKSDSLNSFIINQSIYEKKIDFLVSPVTSTGIPVTRFNQLFLRACDGNKADPVELATAVWQILKSQDEKIISDGKVLYSDQENLQHLTNLAKDFVKNALPELRRLKIN